MMTSRLLLLAVLVPWLFSPLAVSCGGQEEPSASTVDLVDDQADGIEEEPIEEVSPELGTDPIPDPIEVLPDVLDLDLVDQEPRFGEIICRPCLDSSQCQDPGNVCLTLPSGESVCGLDCSDDPDTCPAETFCAELEDEETVVYQCVPERLYCVDLCGEPPRECSEPGDLCDPLTGECHPPYDLCQECQLDLQCGQGNYCLTFPDIDQSRACGRACTAIGGECPAGFGCAIIDEAGTIRQCVPLTFTCIERCETVICEGDTYCNPLTGQCEAPLGLCEPCLIDLQCGGATDLCLGLPDGFSYCGQDCGATAGENAGICPPGYYCYPVGTGVSQCIPITLACVDHCLVPEPVSCPEGHNCDPIDGSCHPSLYGLCQGPCQYNYECGGQNDLCISFSSVGGTFCGMDCGPETPCPVGYTCYPLSDEISYQCAPSDYELACVPCDSVECPQGEFCRPVDGSCLPQPAYCTEHAECLSTEVCNYWDDRCEPTGLVCRYDEYWDCPYGTTCSAASVGMWGTCLLECATRPEGCPDTAPACGDFYRPWWDVCVERGLGGAERCGWLVDWDQEVGRPCPYSESYDGCPTAASTCLQEVVEGIPGFCTAPCNPLDADPCPAGGHCHRPLGLTESYCIPVECRCLVEPELEPGETDVLQAALDLLDLIRCELASTWSERVTAGPHLANDPYRLERVGRTRNEPLSAAPLVAELLAALSHPASLVEAVELASGNLGQTLAWEYMQFDGYDLCSAIQGLWFGLEETAPTCEELAGLEAAIPEEMRGQLARIIASAGFASRQRNSTLPTTLDAAGFDALLASLHRLLIREPEPPPALAELREILLGTDYPLLFWAAANLANAIETELPALLAIEPASPRTIDVLYETPLGTIVIQGDEDHTYCDRPADCEGVAGGVTVEDPILLLVDTAGNDTYLLPAGATFGSAQAVSILLDLAGDDLYGYPPAPDDPHAGSLYPDDGAGRAQPPDPPISLSTVGRQGSGRGGIGFLFDLGLGSDRYESLRMSQGFGLLGVGALVDDGCTPAGEDSCQDSFRSEALSQGAGLFGIGVVLLGPTDSLVEGYSLVQGVGGPFGMGLLIDEGGDESYIAWPGDPDHLLYPPDELSSLGNHSAAQGAGIGVPSQDPAAGGNLSGGMGWLIDRAGEDSYVAGVMAQGAGYWHGLGVLIDQEGGDDYQGLGYLQGFGHHFGMGLLVDQGGDDSYGFTGTAGRNLLGSGEDFGVGMVIEESGADRYHAGSRSLGFGFFNGTGLFFENDGNDGYTLTSADTLGKATLSILGSEPDDNPRREAKTIGLFIEAGGTDTYSGRDLGNPPIGNGQLWIQQTPVQPGEQPLIEWGLGADAEGSSTMSTFP
ncbi:MAG: hypothetical protein JW797_03665 [Bradymonadales bacterium]|nr:hypothetical protein [Bradymonadales bacterium]